MTRRTRLSGIEAYTTRDGSIVRELMHPDHHSVSNQSLALAELPPGRETLLHRHLRSEEIYHFLEGEGEMWLGEARFPVRAGDTVVIAPGTPHRLRNTGANPLCLLCACSPPYAHEDTELLEPS